MKMACVLWCTFEPVTNLEMRLDKFMYKRKIFPINYSMIIWTHCNSGVNDEYSIDYDFLSVTLTLLHKVNTLINLYTQDM